MIQSILSQLLSLLVGSILFFSGAGLYAQEITATSDTLGLHFGYPVLRTQDDMTFIDENENDQIDPDEGCLIAFTLVNQSTYPARNIQVIPKELNGLEGISIPKQVKVGDLAAGASTRVEVGILGGENLASGTANFSFLVQEGDNTENTTVVFSVQVNRSGE